MMTTLTRPQRAGYLLSLLLLSAGWLLLLALTLESPLASWSRHALVLQAAALLVAHQLVPRTLAQRLVLYPLVLAASIYLLDSTLPPPTFPAGWPRELIPRLVLGGLLVDWLWTIHQRRRARQSTVRGGQQHMPLADAAQLLGLSAAELRARIHVCRVILYRDAGGHEYVSAADLPSLRRRTTPAWWVLLVWMLLMSGVLVFALPLVVPAAWQRAAQVVWCSVLMGGMLVWVRANGRALSEDDWTPRVLRHQNEDAPRGEGGRTIPLTAVQARFLAVMEREQDP